MSEPFWVPLGGAGVDYKGDWAAGTQYQPGDVVRRGGVDYMAVNPSLGSEPPLAVKGVDFYELLDRTTTDLNVTGLTETVLASATIEAGKMGPNSSIRFKVVGDVLGTSGPGGGGACTYRLKLGGTTLLTITHDYVNNIARQVFFSEATIVGQNSLAEQVVTWVTPSVGDDSANPKELLMATPIVATVNMAVSQLLQLTAQWSVVGQNSVRRFYSEVARL